MEERGAGFSLEDERAGDPIRWWSYWQFEDGFVFARGDNAPDRSTCVRFLDLAEERMNAEHRTYREQKGLS